MATDVNRALAQANNLEVLILLEVTYVRSLLAIGGLQYDQGLTKLMLGIDPTIEQLIKFAARCRSENSELESMVPADEQDRQLHASHKVMLYLRQQDAPLADAMIGAAIEITGRPELPAGSKAAMCVLFNRMSGMAISMYLAEGRADTCRPSYAGPESLN